MATRTRTWISAMLVGVVAACAAAAILAMLPAIAVFIAL
jgi:hypothetical protein